MSQAADLEELMGYLVRSSRLSAEEVRHLLEEVFAFLHETPAEFVRRRHRALQADGFSNAEILQQLGRELSGRRFRAPPFSMRQIRRMIYG